MPQIEPYTERAEVINDLKESRLYAYFSLGIAIYSWFNLPKGWLLGILHIILVIFATYAAASSISTINEVIDTFEVDEDRDGLGIWQEEATWQIWLRKGHENGIGDADVTYYCTNESTDVNSNDTDGDKLLDGDELNQIFLTDQVRPEGGIIDLDDFPNLYVTDPTLPDTDGDGLWDGDESHPDRIFEDGWPNIEVDSDWWNSYPTDYDSDGDGLWDGDEVTGDDINLDGLDAHSFDSDPMKAYSDNDDLRDDLEVLGWTWDFSSGAPVAVRDNGENAFHTDPMMEDTDGDTVDDDEDLDPTKDLHLKIDLVSFISLRITIDSPLYTLDNLEVNPDYNADPYFKIVIDGNEIKANGAPGDPHVFKDITKIDFADQAAPHIYILNISDQISSYEDNVFTSIISIKAFDQEYGDEEEFDLTDLPGIIDNLIGDFDGDQYSGNDILDIDGVNEPGDENSPNQFDVMVDIFNRGILSYKDMEATSSLLDIVANGSQDQKKNYPYDVELQFNIEIIGKED